MSRTLYCQFLKKEAPGMAFQLVPGELGKRIFENISQEAFAQWQKKQTMLINEHRLNLMEPQARKFLEEQMEAYLFEGKEPDIKGYVPPEK